ncbi:MAG: 2-oxoglutarate ferredoxin oxidoreductase subunit alpha, partial [Chloroflexi bacterium]|nr:2-oxoglutarate ferredoxin oxidoreductase subunit alpha [Chloroflexota bacterium]
REGYSVAHAHLRYLNPLPSNLRDLLDQYKQVIVPELNGGQLAFLLRGWFALDIQSFPKLHARPFKINEIYNMIVETVS